ncbi:MAG: hypothetical protein WAS73_07180 [Defluviicoccus sp.]
MKIPVISALKGAIVRNAILAAAVALAALVQPLHSLAPLRPAPPTEAAVAVRAMPAVSAAQAHDDCSTAPKPAAAVCALACAAAIAVVTSPIIDLWRAERLAEPASRQPPLRRGRHHPPDPRPPRSVA